ncbi:MAG: GNAT family N-acetyltransferase [Chloroflexi bacterium]|nr:GNAT family N-acetyltransferase [Chloroflexota bacterium]
MPATTINVDDDIVLRRPTLPYAEDIYALVDANRDHLRRWLAFADSMRSVKDQREWLKQMDEPGHDRWEYPMMVLHKGKLVGMIGVQNLGSRARFCEIGYWLAESAQGQGIITRSCRALLDYLFAFEGINRVQIRAAVGNTRSRAIPERLGFTLEGILRQADLASGVFLDMAMYSLLREEWQRKSEAMLQ